MTPGSVSLDHCVGMLMITPSMPASSAFRLHLLSNLSPLPATIRCFITYGVHVGCDLVVDHRSDPALLNTRRHRITVDLLAQPFFTAAFFAASSSKPDE